MIKLNFKQFSVPVGVGCKSIRTGDVRESFADIIYSKSNGIRAHDLAFKIYRSEGVESFSSEEVRLIKEIAETFCTPCFIDGLRKQLEGGAE